MISNKKSPQPSQVSSWNISTVLSENVLGYLLEYIELNSLSTLGTLNRMFKKIIWDKKILTLFNFFSEERRNSLSIIYMEEVFCTKDPQTSYIPLLKNKLKQKDAFTSSQKTHVEREIINSLLKRLCPQGVMDLRRKVE